MEHTLLRRTIVDLFEIGAVKFGEFRLKLHESNPDAPLSPIYVDLRLVRSHPYLLRNVVAILGRRVVSLNPDFVADVPTAATPIVGAMAAFFDIPMLTPRLAAKAHGTAAKVEGDVRQGAHVVVVDDLITKADSKLAAIEGLEGAGLVVRDVVVLIDRCQGGGTELAKRGYSLHAAATLLEMLEVYEAERMITGAQVKRVREYLGMQG